MLYGLTALRACSILSSLSELCEHCVSAGGTAAVVSFVMLELFLFLSSLWRCESMLTQSCTILWRSVFPAVACVIALMMGDLYAIPEKLKGEFDRCGRTGSRAK